MKNWKIGIQMYNLREELKQDFKGVCRELVKLGYDGGEIAFNYGGMEPDELAAFCEEIGLTICSIHVKGTQFAPGGEYAKDFEYAKALKCGCIICSGSGDFTQPEVWGKTAGRCRLAGRACSDNGLIFAYHNHDRELVDIGTGEMALDRILSTNHPVEVMTELDVYWLTKGGQNPVTYINRYGNRLPRLHLKDMNPEDRTFTELGTGCVDLEACISAANQTICQWLVYEQDKCKGDPMQSAVVSAEYLKKILGR